MPVVFDEEHSDWTATCDDHPLFLERGAQGDMRVEMTFHMSRVPHPTTNGQSSDEVSQ